MSATPARPSGHAAVSGPAWPGPPAGNGHVPRNAEWAVLYLSGHYSLEHLAALYQVSNVATVRRELRSVGVNVQASVRPTPVAPGVTRSLLHEIGVSASRTRWLIDGSALVVACETGPLAEPTEGGMTVEEAAKECGALRRAAGQRLGAAGVTIRPNRAIRKEVDIPRLIEGYESGMSLKEAGRQCGISRDTARRRLDAAGMGLIAPAVPLQLTVAEVLYRRGYAEREIARLTGHSERLVCRVVAKEKEKELARLELLGVDIEKLKAIYRIVASVSDTAKVLYLSRNNVLAGLRAAGAEILDAPDPEAAPVHLPEATWWWQRDQEILARVAQRQSSATIASALHVSIAEVCDVIRTYQHRDRTTPEVLRRWAHGESPGVIAIRMGMRLDWVKDVLAKYSASYPRHPASHTTVSTQQRRLHPAERMPGPGPASPPRGRVHMPHSRRGS